MTLLSSAARSASRFALPFLAVFLLSACGRQASWKLSNVAHVVSPLQFSMESTSGHVATAKDFHGKVVLMYFGYTHCPDVCPTTLAEMAGVLRKLGPDARDVRLLFVTVDPKRDTLPVLTNYVDAFDKAHFVGLRGTPKQVADMAKRYRVSYGYEKPDADGDYVVNHSSAIFIFGRDGNARLLGTSIDTAAEYEADLKRLVRQG